MQTIRGKVTQLSHSFSKAREEMLIKISKSAAGKQGAEMRKKVFRTLDKVITVEEKDMSQPIKKKVEEISDKIKNISTFDLVILIVYQTILVAALPMLCLSYPIFKSLVDTVDFGKAGNITYAFKCFFEKEDDYELNKKQRESKVFKTTFYTAAVEIIVATMGTMLLVIPMAMTITLLNITDVIKNKITK